MMRHPMIPASPSYAPEVPASYKVSRNSLLRLRAQCGKDLIRLDTCYLKKLLTGRRCPLCRCAL